MADLEAFVVHMRHELRNPVNAILGYSQLLLDEAGDSLGESARRDLGQIEAAGRQLCRLIDEILDPVCIPEAEVPQVAVRLRHALRTPVTSVQGYAEMLLEEFQGSPMVADLDRVHAAAGQLVVLADSIERLYLLRSGAASLAPGESPPEAVAAATALTQAGETSSGGGLVLVVDDQEVNRALLERRLQRQGHRVVLADGGAQGLALARSLPVDVILLDILMPEPSGYEMLARLKADDALKDIPVLMITAMDDPASVSRCIGLGADDYLAKPFDPLLLRARVSACLGRKRARDFELAYLRGVAAVTSAASAVEAGSFDPSCLDEVGRRSDALGRLARLFRSMGVEVAARERRLREQVQELTIAIDHRKKAAQVAEITESDYFRGLQERVRDLGTRRADKHRR
jgi:DNA-binding response OmpR family regulator